LHEDKCAVYPTQEPALNFKVPQLSPYYKGCEERGKCTSLRGNMFTHGRSRS